MAEEDRIYNVIDFEIGEVEDYLALFLHYAKSKEQFDRNDFEAFVVALDRNMAAELGEALIERARAQPFGHDPETRQ